MKNTIFSKENEIFRLAKDSRFLPNAAISLIIFIILLIVSELIGIIPNIFIMKLLGKVSGVYKNSIQFSLGRLFIPCGMTILGFFVWVRFIERRKIRTMGFNSLRAGKKYIRGFLLGIFMMTVITMAFYCLGTVSFRTLDIKNHGINTMVSVFIVLIGWIVQGASEEIMVRGWLMPVIGARHNVILALSISSCLFAALHLGNDNVSRLSLINLVLYGLFAAFYVMWEGGLWGICAFHSAWNWAQGNVFGYFVSGIKPEGGSLIYSITDKNASFITGGLFGPEGGLVVTSILSIGIIVLVMLMINRNHKTMAGI